MTGTATTASIVTVNEQPTTRLGEYFAGTASGDNSTSATEITANIHAVNPGAGPNGEDVVSTATKSKIVPPEEEAFTYDDDGNLTADGKWTYTWDAENRLIAIIPKTGNEALIGKKLTFGYDTDAKRIWQDTANWNTGTSGWDSPSRERYLYDGWNLLVITDDTLTTASKRFTWGYDLSNTFESAGGVTGLLLSHADSAGALPMYDGNGNVIALGDEDSELIGKYEYGPFGQLLLASDEQLLEHPFQWSSKIHISNTGLSYYGYRFYSHRLERWIGRDPLKENGGLNLYGATDGDSINFIDFTGLSKKKRKKVKDSSGSAKIEVIDVKKCEIVILYGHGHSSIPHEFNFSSGCSGGEFVGCFPGTTNSTIPSENQLPDPDMGNDTKTTGPNGDFHEAMISAKKRAQKKAKSICENKSNCCTAVSISYQVQGGFFDWLVQPDYSGWNENIKCDDL